MTAAGILRLVLPQSRAAHERDVTARLHAAQRLVRRRARELLAAGYRRASAQITQDEHDGAACRYRAAVDEAQAVSDEADEMRRGVGC